MRGQLFPVLVWSAVLASGVDAVQADETPGAVATPTRAPRRAMPSAATSPASSPTEAPAPRGEARDGRDIGPQDPAALPPALPPEATIPRRLEDQVISGAGAGSAPCPAPLSLAALEDLALRNNPTIREAEALIVQQQGLLRQLTRYPNPAAGWVQSTPSRRSEGATQGAFISQDIVTAGKLRVAGQAERVEIEWRVWQLKAQIGRVVNDVRIRYFEVLGAQQAMITAADLERLASDDLMAVRQLLEAKQVSRPDVLQAEIHLNAVRASLQDARLRHQAAWQQLANIVGVPQLPPTMLPDSLEGDIPQFNWQETLQWLLAESPVLRAQAAQVREAEIEVQLQKRLVVPNINVQTVIQRDYVKNFNQVSTLVSAPIPLFNRNRGNIINAEATVRQQQEEYKRLQLALADQLSASFQQYLAARNQVEHLREILPRTQENLKLTTQAFKEGQKGFDFLRVRDAEDIYLRTQTSYIDALASLRKLTIEITGLELIGGLNPTEIGTALQAAPGVPTGLGGVLLQFSRQEAAGVGRTLPGAFQATVTGPE